MLTALTYTPIDKVISGPSDNKGEASVDFFRERLGDLVAVDDLLPCMDDIVLPLVVGLDDPRRRIASVDTLGGVARFRDDGDPLSSQPGTQPLVVRGAILVRAVVVEDNPTPALGRQSSADREVVVVGIPRVTVRAVPTGLGSRGRGRLRGDGRPVGDEIVVLIGGVGVSGFVGLGLWAFGLLTSLLQNERAADHRFGVVL